MVERIANILGFCWLIYLDITFNALLNFLFLLLWIWDIALWCVYYIKECNRGWYGIGCNKTCGHCRNENQCSNVNGICETECDVGFEVDQCKTCENTCICYGNSTSGTIALRKLIILNLFKNQIKVKTCVAHTFGKLWCELISFCFSSDLSTSYVYICSCLYIGVCIMM